MLKMRFMTELSFYHFNYNKWNKWNVLKSTAFKKKTTHFLKKSKKYLENI